MRDERCNAVIQVEIRAHRPRTEVERSFWKSRQRVERCYGLSLSNLFLRVPSFREGISAWGKAARWVLKETGKEKC